MERLEKLREGLQEAKRQTLAHLANGCKCPTLSELLLWEGSVGNKKILPCDIRLVKGVTGVQACLSVQEYAYRLYAEGCDVLDAMMALERIASDPGATRVPYLSREWSKREKERGARKD